MPDLTIQTAWTCETNQHFRTTVKGSTGKTYVVTLSPHNQGPYVNNWECNCPHFQARLKSSGAECKHILQAYRKHCGWNASLEPTLEADRCEDGTPCCPECGGNVVAVSVAI